MARGVGWRIVLSIILILGLLIFIIVWLLVFAGAFSLSQNVATVLIALVAFIGLQAAVWLTMTRAISRAAQPPFPHRPPKGRYCPNCGTPNPLDAQYCVLCGIQLPAG